MNSRKHLNEMEYLAEKFDVLMAKISKNVRILLDEYNKKQIESPTQNFEKLYEQIHKNVVEFLQDQIDITKVMYQTSRTDIPEIREQMKQDKENFLEIIKIQNTEIQSLKQSFLELENKLSHTCAILEKKSDEN